jgi:hypothetical protein
MRILFAALRAAVAIAIVAAIVGQLMTSLAFWSDRGVTNIGSNVVNFFSFFTIESNVAAVAVLAVGAGLLATRSGDDPEWFQVTRAAVVSYMVVTGVVYNLLLRGIELPQGATLGWSNEIVHAVAPAYLLLDWILAPGRRAIPARRIGTILVYPLVWVVYTLVRAPFVTDQVYNTDYWYPYPFLNPNSSAQGYISVAFYVVLIAAVIGLTAAGVLWLSRRGGVARAEFRQAS